MPERAKALFAGIDLDLSKPANVVENSPIESVSNPLADTLRVKLNLARAYITIEDFSAAKKSLEEVLRVSNTVDPAITIEAQGLLSELAHQIGQASIDSNRVQVPDQGDLQRAREILEELFRRSGERFRTPEELDYLNRLLRRF